MQKTASDRNSNEILNKINILMLILEFLFMSKFL